MINNHVFSDITFPNPSCTDVRNPNNFCYNNDSVPNPDLAHIHENVAAGGDTDDEYDQQRGDI